MIYCKKCQSENTSYEPFCQKCGALFELDNKEISALLSEAADNMKSGSYRHAVELYKFLAGIGVTEAEREFALILERGLLVPRNIEVASAFFGSAAQKGDILSAYKYSTLLVGNERIAEFWLAYAALHGCKDAYVDAFNLYTRLRDKETAAYYCSQLAEDGDIDAIIEMARRHLYGDGVEQNEAYARWYFEKLERAPLNAVKLYKRLQAIEDESKEPQRPEFTSKMKIMQGLIADARKFGYNKILLSLANDFAEAGSIDASIHIACLHIDGIELEKNVELGISLLEDAVEKGSVKGAKILGDIYAEGRQVDQSNRLAARYYRKAAELGGEGEYESLGDIFYNGSVEEADYAVALKLYEAGESHGDPACRAKARAMRQEREKNYVEGCKIEQSSPEEAFEYFKKSVTAGYQPAHARIGWYYERGIGTEVNRKAAFNHYKAAYEIGDKRAIESLGRCYARGIGTAFDFKKAADLLGQAKEMGSYSADRELYRIYENKRRHMIRSLYSTAMRLYYNKKFEAAREMLETCMKLGVPDATYAIGCLYEFGITTAPDRKIALRFYKKAYSEGYSDPVQGHKQIMLKMSK